MTTVEFLSYLRRLDIKLWCEGDRLRYSAPSAVLPPDIHAELVRRKAELLAFLQTARIPEYPGVPRITPAAHDSPVSASFAQQRLWFLDQWNPGNPVYTIAFALRFSGILHIPFLHQALNTIVQRHEVLRTTFAAVAGEPLQIIAPDLSIELPLVELQSLPEAERERRAWQAASDVARMPFDLVQGPLLRFLLMQLSHQEYILLVTVHHSVFDGWSQEIFLRELALLYGAYMANQPVPLPDLPLQYADVAHWQRQWLNTDTLRQQLAYWQSHLSNLPTLDLPTTYPRPAFQTYGGAVMHFKLPSRLAADLKALSTQQGVTVFMTLLSALSLLLARYSGQNCIPIGSPIANRTHSELEPLIGFFVNTLVLCVDLDREPTFREVVQRVRDVTLGAYAHQDVPFEQLVELLQPVRDLSRHPLFQVMFAFQHTPAEVLQFPELKVQVFPIDTGTAKFDLLLDMHERDNELAGTWEYNTDLFDTVTIARLNEHLQVLLKGIVEQPDQPVAILPLLTEAERYQMLVTWNNTSAHYATDHCIHHLFEAQVQRTPQATAVVFEEQQLTYSQLDQQSNRLAHHLRTLGIGPGDLVAICAERALELVIGLLAILKAGAAYVPIDPAYPQERIAFMLSDMQAAVVLTQTPLLEQMTVSRAQVICLDTIWETISQTRVTPPASSATPDDLAYVLYTSGSTAQPKGVMITHRALCNHMLWMQRDLPLTETDCILQKTPISFDASVWEFYAPLLAGARLLLARPDGHRDVGYLVQSIVRSGVTILQVVPTLLRLLLDEPSFADCTCLRRVFCGGEVLTADVQHRFFATLPHTQLYNLYGPTEATIDTVFWECNPDDLHSGATVPIGRPVANTQIYLLDAALQPVPVGVPGQVYIGGSSLARGYLNRPELTAATFIPHPFSEQPGARLYCTGDRARYRADGVIEFLGRTDYQVKIRGVRIEPGEIESVLRRHPLVSEAVVNITEDVSGDPQLIAYIVPTATAATPSESRAEYAVLDAQELRRHLELSVPVSMLPSAFVLLDELPLLPNGKVNRQALTAPTPERTAADADDAAPRTPLEEALVQIWAEVLGHEMIGIHDDFFLRGGHSLQAMKLVARIATVLHRAVPVKTIFLCPTVARLASELENLPLTSQESSEKPTQGHSGSSDTEPVSSLASSVSLHKPDGSGISVLWGQPASASPWLEIERRSALSLFASGELEPVDAAALGYLEPDEPFADAFRYTWSDGKPFIGDLIQTPHGRIALILLPRFRAELYHDQADLLALIVASLELTARIGGRMLSLAGLIPSATSYGEAIVSAIGNRHYLPKVSTGHATTTAAVVLTIRRILRESRRTMARERVGYLGLGSVGTSSLRLMLRCLPHPAELILCDLYSKRAALEEIKREMVHEAGFRGGVRIVEAHTDVPPAFYTATLIVGATNVPDILDIPRIQPGTLIVDDSAPHCFNSLEIIQRFHTREDILFTEGGVLQAPQPLKRLRMLPPGAEQMASVEQLEVFARQHPYQITGCILSSLLSACFADLPPTLGLVHVDASLQHYIRLIDMGFEAADLHCEAYVLPAEAIQRFRSQHGQGSYREINQNSANAAGDSSLRSE